MYLSSLECYATDKLQCGVADLTMLDEVYSRLSEDALDVSGVVQECESLNDLLMYVYSGITEAVSNELKNIAENEDEVELNYGRTITITESVAEQLNSLAEKLCEYSPHVNCLDTCFQNDLHRTADFDMSVRDNAISLIEFWVDDEKLDVGTVVSQDVTVYSISTDGSDIEYDSYYKLINKKVYNEDDEVICDMSDDEELDYEFMAQRIQDNEHGCVQVILIEDEVVWKNPEDFNKNFDDEDEDEE